MGFLTNQFLKVEENAKKELEMLLTTGESIRNFYLVKEDYFALTSKRVIFVNKSILSSKKTTTGVPYSKITAVSLVKGGAFSITKEIVITMGSTHIEVEMYDQNMAIEIFKEISSII